jgi:hypothetical protein
LQPIRPISVSNCDSERGECAACQQIEGRLHSQPGVA